MPERKIRLWPDPALTSACAPVDLADPSVNALIADLFDTMYAATGRGLAAPQVGVLLRVFVVDATWKDGPRSPRAFINPAIESTSGTTATMDEQCLSIPDLPMPVTRPEAVTLRWADPEGQSRRERFGGILARCIQHEYDHLDGRVLFDHQPPDDRMRYEARYAP